MKRSGRSFLFRCGSSVVWSIYDHTVDITPPPQHVYAKRLNTSHSLTSISSDLIRLIDLHHNQAVFLSFTSTGDFIEERKIAQAWLDSSGRTIIRNGSQILGHSKEFVHSFNIMRVLLTKKVGVTLWGTWRDKYKRVFKYVTRLSVKEGFIVFWKPLQLNSKIQDHSLR